MKYLKRKGGLEYCLGQLSKAVGEPVTCSRTGCVLDYYMSASDMTQNRTGFIIQEERISHANKMQIVHFKPKNFKN